MLSLLLDEHISPAVVRALQRRTRPLSAVHMADWQEGEFLGEQDDVWLREAAAQGLTLVTYDLRTIPPLLKRWAEEGQKHGGVIFVDQRSISPANIGGLVSALNDLEKKASRWDWADRVCFLRR